VKFLFSYPPVAVPFYRDWMRLETSEPTSLIKHPASIATYVSQHLPSRDAALGLRPVSLNVGSWKIHAFFLRIFGGNP